MESTTTTFTTPNNHVVVMKDFITGREFLPIAKGTSATPTAEENIDKVLKMIGIAVVSIDGATENLTDIAQDLPLEDYLFITAQVGKLANFQKTKSTTGTPSSSSEGQS